MALAWETNPVVKISINKSEKGRLLGDEGKIRNSADRLDTEVA